MIRLLSVMLLAAGLSAGAAAQDLPRVALDTTSGKIVLELDAQRAPETVKNFLAYVEAGFYDGTIFHRVIKDFMIQGGGFDEDFNRKTTRDPVRNEADNGLANRRGTVAMARTSDPQSATAQFFINVVDNAFLDFKSATPRGYGYAVFGRVVEGMDVVDTIRQTPTGTRNGFRDVPRETVVIRSATLQGE